MSLPEEDPSEFRVYAGWAYTGKLFTEDGTLHMKDDQYPYTNLARLYVMGARLQDIQFQDAAMDAILSETQTVRGGGTYLPSRAVIPIIYENTVPGDCARRLLVDICVCNRYVDFIVTDEGESYLLFAADVALATIPGSPPPKSMDSIREDGVTCGYHQHGDDEACYRKKLGDSL